MANPISVLRSPITNRIFAARSRAVKGMAPGTRQVVGDKFDVTDEALHAVAHYLMTTDDVKIFELSDGTELHLRADIKPGKGGEDA